MWRIGMVLVIGCNQFYGLDDTRSEETIDTDEDGVVDREDNCPAVRNADQLDADGDKRGDRCDDCPMVATPQVGDADGDLLGDVCDPHPNMKNDCLLLVDTFADPAAFAANWIVDQMPGTMAVAEPGRVVLRGNGTASVTIRERTITGLNDVIALGDVLDTTNALLIVATAMQGPAPDLYGCRLDMTPGIEALGPGIGLPVNSNLVPPVLVGTRFAIRTFTNDTKIGPDPIEFTCRVDFGVSIGLQGRTSQPVVQGPTGVISFGGPIAIDAIAITRFQAEPCPPVVYR